MERKFYTDNFEKMLKDHADDFKMYPSGKPWHGIYNSLHPGRRWPSLATGTLLVVCLLLVGRLNTENTQIFPQLTSASKLQAKSFSHLQENQKKNNTRSTGISTPTDNTQALDATNSDTKPSDLTKSSDLVDVTTLALNSSTENKNTESAITEESNYYNVSGNEDISSKNVIINKPAVNDLRENEVVTAINTKDVDVSLLTTSSSGKVNTLGTINSSDLPDSARLAELTAIANTGKRKNSHISWKFYASPDITYRSFEKKTGDGMQPSFPTAINQNGNSTAYAPEHRMALGFELGTAVLYDVSKKAKIKAGLQFNYTGYNIRAYSVHPINSNLILNNDLGQPYYVSGLSSYSSTPGTTPVTLHNQQLQVSFPVGLEFEYATAGKFHLSAGATFQPTYVLVGSAYVSSSNEKNFIAQSSLLRKWNMSAGFETFVSFKTSNSLTMHIGPQFRYQMLSSYSNRYPHKEHLFDLGIKFGVSKSLF